MDEVKRIYRDVETDVKKTVRDVDGTDVKDSVGNIGDEARKGLGNLGDDSREAGRALKDRPSDRQGDDDVKTDMGAQGDGGQVYGG